MLGGQTVIAKLEINRRAEHVRYLKIFIPPNLMTAGNLVCGFASIVKILEERLIIQAASNLVGRRDRHCG